MTEAAHPRNAAVPIGHAHVITLLSSGYVQRASGIVASLVIRL
jgi:hypothetical protein